MKSLIVNRKIVVSIFTMLLIYGIQTTGYGQQPFTPVNDRTPQVRDAIVALIPGVDSADDVTAAHLSLIKNLNLSEQNITTLKAGDFDGLSSLDSLALYKNRLRSLPADLFSGMSALSRLDLGSNDLSSLPADVFSELSSLSWLSLSFNKLNGLPAGIFSGPSSLNTLNLSYNKLSSLPSDLFSELSSLRTLNLSSNKLSGLPADLFSGVSSLSWLSLSFNELSGLPVGIFSGLSVLRSFYLGDNAVNLSIIVFLEQIEENQFKATAPTGAPFNIVLPLSVVNGTIDGGATTIEILAGDVESEPLTVTPTPGASDPVAVDIVVLPELPIGHYGYSLAEPSSLAGDNDSLIFAVAVPRQGYEPNVNHAPIFAEGISTIRSVAENTDAGVNIGGPVVATDEDDDPLTYGIQGPDAAAFGIVGTTGQLQTRAPLDYETRDAYAVTVIVSDGRGGADTIGVTINVTDENDDPIFIEGDSTIRSVAENTQAGMNIGGAVAATDEDGDPLTYTLGGIDAAAFGIVGTTGQLQTRAPLDYETQDAYSVTLLVSDGKGGTDTIGVAISVTDENDDPIFIEGDSTTRSVAENTAAGVNIGAPVPATDEDGDTLIYRLGGVDAGSFGIIGSSGQLQTRASLDYETQNAYSVAIMVSDGKGGTDTIGVAISITDEDEAVPDEDPVPVVERIVIPPVAETVKTHAPVFADSQTTRSIAENTPAGVNIGSPVSATDADDDTLTYTLGGVDRASFSIVRSSGQLQTKSPLDYETKNAYSVTVTVSDGDRTDAISVKITIIDVDETPKTRAPVFAGDKATRSIAENTPAGVNIGSPVTATDADGDTLIYTLSGTDGASFSIVRSSGQLQTKAPLDYETKNTYTVTVTVSDGERTDIITVTITITDVDETPKARAPVFTGDKTTRSIAENTPAGVNIGSPVFATDADGDTLTYSLSGTDRASFKIVSTSGQLKTHAPLDYETKNAYSVTVTVSDGGRTDAIIVTITITDVDETPPTVDESPQTTQIQGEVSISEIMYAAEERFTPPQWIELYNSGTEIISLRGWTVTIQNENTPDLNRLPEVPLPPVPPGGDLPDLPDVDSPAELRPKNVRFTFKDGFWGDAPTIWPGETVLVVTTEASDDDNSTNLRENQIYDLRWRTHLGLGLWGTMLSVEGFSIKLTDSEGNLVDEVGNFDGKIRQWNFPLGHRGKTKGGYRSSIIRRYVDGVARDGTLKDSWVPAVDANLTSDQKTYYGHENDISSPGIGIVINDVLTKYDINADGVVDLSDLALVLKRLGQAGPNNADVNDDGVVDALDVAEVAGVVNQEAAAPSLHTARLAGLTVADVQAWLNQLQGLNLTDPKLLKGIFFLEQLLSVLIPKETELLPNYPNPFNPETWIPYRLAEDGFVTLTIYDQRGRVIRRLDVGPRTASVYESRSKAIYWDGRNEVGDRVASGIYFYTLTAGGYSATRKMVILK
ncbi:MAG: cadherin domain-containing protein [Candidatus Poribacteria bacterium]|nr:cadherin domain-containing protein [Candidatus Poribacteria bacterium]